MSTTIISTSPGGGVSFMPMTGDMKQPAQPQYPPSVPAVPFASTRPGRVDSYLHRQSMGLGITLIIVGILAVTFNCVGFAVSDELAVVSHGIYCGIMFIITGSFGIAAKTKNKCLIITFMVLAIISATLTLNLLIVGLVGAGINHQECREMDYGFDACPNGEDYQDSSLSACCGYVSYKPPCPHAAIAMEALLAVLAFVAAIVSIWGSAICCRAVCCCSRRLTGTTLPIPGANRPAFVYVDQQQQQQMNGTVFFTGSQIVPGPPPYTIGATIYQPPMQYWTAPLQQPQGQGHVFTTMPSYTNDGQVPTVQSGTLMSPPNYNATAFASAPTDQIHEKM